MIWNIPNKLTASRLVLAVVFFALLGFYDPQGLENTNCVLLLTAFVLYIICGLTDIADGYIARKYNMATTFGRIVDPVVDKVLVVGAFTMLAGNNFVMPAGDVPQDIPAWLLGGMASAIQSWMVVAILARELTVSAVRGYCESQGVSFPATWVGKLKMFLQSITICVLLFQMALLPDATWAIYTKIICVYLVVAVTVASGVMYLSKARGLLKD